MSKQSEVELALGRIFRLMSRPTQAGDVADYERCRAIVMGAVEPVAPDYRPNWTRDRLAGARGQS
jgi:hypothetical protein